MFANSYTELNSSDAVSDVSRKQNAGIFPKVTQGVHKVKQVREPVREEKGGHPIGSMMANVFSKQQQKPGVIEKEAPKKGKPMTMEINTKASAQAQKNVLIPQAIDHKTHSKFNLAQTGKKFISRGSQKLNLANQKRQKRENKPNYHQTSGSYERLNSRSPIRHPSDSDSVHFDPIGDGRMRGKDSFHIKAFKFKESELNNMDCRKIVENLNENENENLNENEMGYPFENDNDVFSSADESNSRTKISLLQTSGIMSSSLSSIKSNTKLNPNYRSVTADGQEIENEDDFIMHDGVTVSNEKRTGFLNRFFSRGESLACEELNSDGWGSMQNLRDYDGKIVNAKHGSGSFLIRAKDRFLAVVLFFPLLFVRGFVSAFTMIGSVFSRLNGGLSGPSAAINFVFSLFTSYLISYMVFQYRFPEGVIYDDDA